MIRAGFQYQKVMMTHKLQWAIQREANKSFSSDFSQISHKKTFSSEVSFHKVTQAEILINTERCNCYMKKSFRIWCNCNINEIKFIF